MRNNWNAKRHIFTGIIRNFLSKSKTKPVHSAELRSTLWIVPAFQLSKKYYFNFLLHIVPLVRKYRDNYHQCFLQKRKPITSRMKDKTTSSYWESIWHGPAEKITFEYRTISRGTFFLLDFLLEIYVLVIFATCQYSLKTN